LGWNAPGQLGNGTTISSLTPTAAVGITGAIAITAGFEHTCALLPGGMIKC